MNRWNYYKKYKLTISEELNTKKTVVLNSFSRVYFISPVHLIISVSGNFYITLDWRILLFEIYSLLQSGISSFCLRLRVHLRDKDFFRYVPIWHFGNKKGWCWCGWVVCVGSCDAMGSFNVFEDFFLRDILHVFGDFVCQLHFCVISCLLRLMFFNVFED